MTWVSLQLYLLCDCIDFVNPQQIYFCFHYIRNKCTYNIPILELRSRQRRPEIHSNLPLKSAKLLFGKIKSFHKLINFGEAKAQRDVKTALVLSIFLIQWPWLKEIKSLGELSSRDSWYQQLLSEEMPSCVELALVRLRPVSPM